MQPLAPPGRVRVGPAEALPFPQTIPSAPPSLGGSGGPGSESAWNRLGRSGYQPWRAMSAMGSGMRRGCPLLLMTCLPGRPAPPLLPGQPVGWTLLMALYPALEGHLCGNWRGDETWATASAPFPSSRAPLLRLLSYAPPRDAILTNCHSPVGEAPLLLVADPSPPRGTRPVACVLASTPRTTVAIVSENSGAPVPVSLSSGVGEPPVAIHAGTGESQHSAHCCSTHPT